MAAPRQVGIALAVLGAGCSFRDPETDWSDQLAPEGPCWQVDLGDGLSGVDELHALYGCINQTGELDPLGGLDASLDTPGRAERPVGDELTAVLNGLPQAGVDPWGWASLFIEINQDGALDPLLDLLLEGIYGIPADRVRRGEGQLVDSPLTPLLPVVEGLASRDLDADLAGVHQLGQALESPITDDLLCSVGGFGQTSDPDLAALGARLLPDIGDAIDAAQSPENDRWADASGDSIRDLADALLVADGDGQTGLAPLLPGLRELLADTSLRDQLQRDLVDLQQGGHLSPLGMQLRYLSEVDTQGGSLGASEDSALLALLRLLSAGNTDVDCSLDLWVTDLQVHLDNVSVALLTELARRDPDQVQGGVSLLGSVLGSNLSQGTLEAVADSGVCPVIDRQLVADLQSLDRFNDTETADLLRAFLALLASFDSADRVPELVDLLDVFWTAGLTPPTEEALRDLAPTQAVDDVLAMLPMLDDPSALQTTACPTGATPLDFDQAWALADSALSANSWHALGPLATVLVEQDGTWQAARRFSALIHEGAAVTRQLPTIAGQLIELDPELRALRDVSVVLQDDGITYPLLRAAECPALMDSLGDDALPGDAPLPFVATLIIDGTLDTMLRTLDLLVDLLRQAPPS